MVVGRERQEKLESHTDQFNRVNQRTGITYLLFITFFKIVSLLLLHRKASLPGWAGWLGVGSLVTDSKEKGTSAVLLPLFPQATISMILPYFGGK